MQSLGKLRPVSQEVGWALEEATKDKAIRVRWQARTSLMAYRVAGYRSEPKVVERPVMPAGQPLVVMPARPVMVVPVVPNTGPVMVSGETAPPPLAPVPVPAGPQPLPQLLPQPTIVPVVTPKQPQPSQSSEQGPDIK